MLIADNRFVALALCSVLAGCGGSPPSEQRAEPSPEEAASTECKPHRGLDCADDEFCDFELDAVCGANDRAGVCRRRPRECPSGGSPVCACNDQTFPSACEAHRFGVGVQGHGACGPPI